MTPFTTAKPCRRQMMLAAVAATILLLTAPHTARAQDSAPAAAMVKQDKAAPVSEAEIAKAKAEVDKLRAMSQSERVDYMVDKRQNADPAYFADRKNDMRARKAYIDSLPEDQRKELREQMKADRKLVKEKMKAKWEAMTPAEREAVKAKRKAEFDKLPDDVKAKMKEKHKHHKDHKKGEHGDKAFGKKDHADTPAAPPAE